MRCHVGDAPRSLKTRREGAAIFFFWRFNGVTKKRLTRQSYQKQMLDNLLAHPQKASFGVTESMSVDFRSKKRQRPPERPRVVGQRLTDPAGPVAL